MSVVVRSSLLVVCSVLWCVVGCLLFAVVVCCLGFVVFVVRCLQVVVS